MTIQEIATIFEKHIRQSAINYLWANLDEELVEQLDEKCQILLTIEEWEKVIEHIANKEQQCPV